MLVKFTTLDGSRIAIPYDAIGYVEEVNRKRFGSEAKVHCIVHTEENDFTVKGTLDEVSALVAEPEPPSITMKVMGGIIQSIRANTPIETKRFDMDVRQTHEEANKDWEKVVEAYPHLIF